MTVDRGFTGSAAYWQQRYAGGGNSGKGSYGRLADFKARVLNAFVAEHGIGTVLEFGCGDGNQLSLAEYPSYTGYDVSAQAVELCRERFLGDPTKSFHLVDDYDGRSADLSMSLDVVFHLVEDEGYEAYMHGLFDSAERFVVVYATDFDREPLPRSPHVRHRRFTPWVQARRPDFASAMLVENEFAPGSPGGDTSPANFHFFQRIRG